MIVIFLSPGWTWFKLNQLNKRYQRIKTKVKTLNEINVFFDRLKSRFRVSVFHNNNNNNNNNQDFNFAGRSVGLYEVLLGALFASSSF